MFTEDFEREAEYRRITAAIENNPIYVPENLAFDGDNKKHKAFTYIVLGAIYDAKHNCVILPEEVLNNAGIELGLETERYMSSCRISFNLGDDELRRYFTAFSCLHSSDEYKAMSVSISENFRRILSLCDRYDFLRK